MIATVVTPGVLLQARFPLLEKSRAPRASPYEFSPKVTVAVNTPSTRMPTG